MRLLSIRSCRAGMRLGKKIYSEEGLVLLGEHVELTDALIRRLDQLGINYVYVEDPRTDDITVPDMITDETRRRAMGEIRGQFRKLMDESTRRKGAPALQLSKTFGSVLNMVIDDLSRHETAMAMLMNLSICDHYLYQHSLNVCVYSTMLGMCAGYSQDELFTLGLGALLHDIGKTQISMDLLNKPGSLTASEFDAMKRHAEIGYRLLKDEPNIPLLSAHCAFQHHERLDGSGYPRGIGGSEIHDFARWIGLVDSYDAMTTHRVYRGAMLPHQALEVLYTGSGTLYDKDKIELFRDRVAIYPLGLSVQLNTGETGVVVDINANYPARPIVRILQDADGQETAPYEVDLSKQHTLLITNVSEA
ncbi:HD-GYP domain-containing protein [Paenibacillus sp. y28]|uniref:HD-GYP domain-containing protein n=1 Tax=Paenibacillus sp. y28 TaxID=3129110 RepID=UPI003015B79B